MKFIEKISSFSEWLDGKSYVSNWSMLINIILSAAFTISIILHLVRWINW